MVEPRDSLPVGNGLEATDDGVLLVIQLHLDLEPFYGIEDERGRSGGSDGCREVNHNNSMM